MTRSRNGGPAAGRRVREESRTATAISTGTAARASSIAQVRRRRNSTVSSETSSAQGPPGRAGGAGASRRRMRQRALSDNVEPLPGQRHEPVLEAGAARRRSRAPARRRPRAPRRAVGLDPVASCPAPDELPRSAGATRPKWATRGRRSPSGRRNRRRRRARRPDLRRRSSAATRPAAASTRDAPPAASGVRTRTRRRRRRAARRGCPGPRRRPTLITAAWVHICSTSASRWLETKTVVPSPASDRTRCAHLAGALRVEAVGGFVEHQQLVAASQRVRDAEALLHAQRVGADLLAAPRCPGPPVSRARSTRRGGCGGRGRGRRSRAGAGWRARRGTGRTRDPRPGRPTRGSTSARAGPASARRAR